MAKDSFMKCFDTARALTAAGDTKRASQWHNLADNARKLVLQMERAYAKEAAQ